MSATRRAASETNILAMLDRQTSTALPRRLLRSALAMPPLFWYGTASVLVCGMVATLAWLAHDGGSPAAADTALAGPVTPAGARVEKVAAVQTTPADSASLTASVTAHVPATAPAPVAAAAPDPAPKPGATIVNLSPAPAEPAVQHPRQQPGPTAPHELQREPQRLAAHPATARTAPPRTPAHAGPAAPARSRRHPAPAKAAAPSVDTDVALISAIIQHAATRQATEEAACTGTACGPRMPDKP
jgi:hypothetical protein